VSGCRSHGELVGPYVLGALEPAEADEMRRHLAACERCAAEERDLATLPALLDRAQAGDTVEAPPPRLEEAVLDRFVRERSAPASPPARRWRRAAIPAAAAAAVILALLVALLPAGDDRAYGRAELRSMAAGGDAAGVADVEEVPAGTHVDLRAHDLPMDGGDVYELWCVRSDGRWVSGGSFRARGDGSAAAELTAAVSPGEYHVVVVTRRSAGGERGAEIMRGELAY
jgi:Anti-sigma-K factor rskA/Putative zinc-finger